MSEYDILIIGAGPIGLACGIAAKKAGLSYVIVEKGCLVNSLYNYPANMTFFSTSERLEIGGVPFMSLNNKPNRAEALEYYRRVTQVFSLNVHLFEEVKAVIKNKDNFFSITTSKNNYTAKHIIVSTGFYDIPVLMHVPGEEMNKVVHYYKDPHYYAFQKVLVVGAQNSAIDAALETWRKGAEVTMVVREKEIGERVKYWVRPDIINRIAEGSIKAYFSASVIEIRKNEVDIQTKDGPVTIANDFVIAMTGYRPGFDFLRKIGIELSNDESLRPSYDPETMQTNNKGIYLAGVVCGGMDTHKWFIENSREHADKIIKNILAMQEK
ncbi:YpdA family putative bacillithiol disulfide reductase [Panacibacter ginsenosidivorans]|uniref:YpdA family putative bacillithiol disulfide reductase n=1 Tax=Panacibacter ginsenosidivorans TaxID=1813871 RepID=A0A5B8V7I3_9BACT|nr:YpdA family putative bacillithiol disulfide reductase [Panacibacter ginsenosidivorans]QEC67219.1 YpdA family putative bacillithiol disulfide reductase [Panacibacter ginsenosidivorans]